jgi:hypothetical protein
MPPSGCRANQGKKEPLGSILGWESATFFLDFVDLHVVCRM